MRLAPQTHALTSVTHDRIRVFQRTEIADAMIDILFRYRDQGRYRLHGFVVMPDHIHALITPCSDQSIERCAQCIKGGFSFAVRDSYKGEIWQRGFHAHRVRDAEDFRNQLLYIANDPSRRQYADYPHMHTRFQDRLDGMPECLS